jgi:DNA-binding NtrC family response regulator
LVAEKAELEREYSRIIHSSRKHGKYIAVNCGPFQKARLTVNSSDKRGFTGATGTREGYFEVADGGTIFR